MTQQNDIRSEFLIGCNLVLKFLVTDFGFSGPQIEEDDSVLTVYYLKHEVAIEIYLDKRDEMASVRIIRMENGEIPDVYRMNKRGEIVKEYLTALLQYRGIKDFSYEVPSASISLSKRGKEIHKSIFADAFWLKKYGQDILEGSAKIFEGYNEPGDRF